MRSQLLTLALTQNASSGALHALDADANNGSEVGSPQLCRTDPGTRDPSLPAELALRRQFTGSDWSSLRNKRPGLWGRPSCKDVAIGVARIGARRSGERKLRIPPADRMSRRSSSVVRAPCAGVRACLCAGVAQCAASSKGKRPAKKRVGTLNKKKALRACCEAKRAEGSEQ